MQQVEHIPVPAAPRFSFSRALSWFLVGPMTAAVIFALVAATVLTSYRGQHANRIYTGVSIWGVDLSGMDRAEARRALGNAFPSPEAQSIILSDAGTDTTWTRSLADLGVTFDVDRTVGQAMLVGRDAGPIGNLFEQFEMWYFGRALAPIVVFDESKADALVAEIASDIDRPPLDATLSFEGGQVTFGSAQVGRTLDVADTRQRLQQAVTELRPVELQLLVHETLPQVADTAEVAARIEQMIGLPMTVYLQQPLDGVDLDRVEIASEVLVGWLRLQRLDNGDGATRYEVIVDENAARQWLAQYGPTVRRDPVNARFYFDDFTHELVVVEPHTNGRALDVEATLQQLLAQLDTPNRSLPFVITEIVPTVHGGATSADLGITELVSESTTWFYGSSINRKHNIARAAASFYGIVIAPGEEFSFNHFLGDVSEEDGYETGLIIVGGRTVKGVGGGVCQVSTTIFQTAFWAGFPIQERWEHGYRVGYYDDGEGPGMDATVFSPIVDFRFVNNTPHHLLIENYFNEQYQSLTFKFYSTSLGRQVEKEGPVIENVRPPNPDVWEFNEELAEGEIQQVDWAVEGADVTVRRIVYNRDGDLLLEDTFVSNYIPWQNVYQYGPGVDPATATPPPQEQ